MHVLEMNSEESRLQTFRNWPVHAPVDARRIAQAGFFYLDQGFEVKCFSCGGVISEWNYGDKVMARHRTMNPRCPFVLSPSLSGNIPISSSESPTLTLPQISSNSSAGISSTNSPEETIQSRTNARTGAIDQGPSMYTSEAARLESFANWPIPFIVTPERLAKAGFYYVQQGDKVRCAYCSGIVGRWEAGDDPEIEHRRHYPICPFLLNRTTTVEPNIASPSGVNLRGGDDTDSTMRSLGVQSHRIARHPKYISTESRLATFTAWPGDVTKTPDELAEAGFYYAGSGDQVRCFHCDGGLKLWEPSDDPWLEHARWFPECGFVVLVKGQKFIDEAIERLPPVIPENINNAEESGQANRQVNTNLGPPARIRQVTEEELTGLMSTAQAVAALQVGLDQSRVKMALRQKMEQTGLTFSSAEDLIVATLDIQHDEAPSLDCEEVWVTPPNSPLLRTRNPNRRHRASQPRPVRTSDSSETSDSDAPQSRSESETKPRVPSDQTPDNSSVSEKDLPVGTSPDRHVTLEEENRRLREARLCKICMDNEVCVVFLPCGHLVTCVNCAHSLADCPVCRQPIKATVRTFLS